MKEILPCPFCASHASVEKGDFGEYFVVCDNPNCGGRLGTNCWQTDEETAIRAWNRREFINNISGDQT